MSKTRIMCDSFLKPLNRLIQTPFVARQLSNVELRAWISLIQSDLGFELLLRLFPQLDPFLAGDGLGQQKPP